MTKIMIAEDNTSVFSCYQKFLSKDKSVEIIGYAKDGKTAVKMYKEKKPDVLLLDLGLPRKNGLNVINDLCEYENERNNCNIIILSGDVRLRKRLLNTRKVYSIIPKPVNFRTLSYTINEIKKEQLLNNFPEHKCRDLLIQLKLKPYSDTGKLLTDIIKLSYYDLDLLGNMKEIYFIMSCKKSCKPEKIRSSLRSCIRTVNRFATPDILHSLFFINHNDINNIISPQQFVNCIVSYLSHE